MRSEVQQQLFGEDDGSAVGASRFACIVADPPWQQKAGPGGIGYSVDANGRQQWNMDSKKSRDLPYCTMSVESICNLPVGDLFADDAHLYLWTTNCHVEDAYKVSRAWGFKPSTLLAWIKAPMGGGLGGAFGISTEFILFSRRGKLKAKSRVGTTWFGWTRPYGENGAPVHSKKPEEFQTMVESVSPGPYLELFARRRRSGWSVWGNQVVSDVRLETKGDA